MLLCHCSHPYCDHTLYGTGRGCNHDNGKDDGRQCKCWRWQGSPIMGEESKDKTKDDNPVIRWPPE